MQKNEESQKNCVCENNKIRVDNSCYQFAPATDNFGKEVILSLLDRNNDWKKPIYIDVKHMDVRSRLDYYLLHDSLQKATGDTIPIIYSHGAVSGEKLKVAYYTSVSPMMDVYKEIINPEKFYKKRFLNPNKPKFNCGLFLDYSNNYNAKEWFTAVGMDTSLITAQDLKLEDKEEDAESVGWFYPWSINLFDEEIKKIYDSDGIIGVMAEERTLGYYLPNYNTAGYKKRLRKALIDVGFFDTKVSKKQLDSFMVAECFLRSLLHCQTIWKT